jgi:orotate phosphoribosyltransferase
MASGVAAARASTYYIDCRVITLSPDGLALVARLMLESLRRYTGR